ncbi:MAG: acyl transferase [Dinghuibacter sp.]|nr:acyl transferase [Dinghuibacter sp.]
MIAGYINKLFTNTGTFEEQAQEAFRWQYAHNALYRQFAQLVHKTPEQVRRLTDIPFMPISFFKTHHIHTEFPGMATAPAVVFESSGTTGATTSRHYVTDTELYKKNYTEGFRQFYGEPGNWCILALLPSYLERNNSSLVYMVNGLMEQSAHPQNGFFLHEYSALHQRLRQLEAEQQPTLLIGVSFALLDFAAQFPLPLKHTVVMETGGMKGRGRELTREELHQQLGRAFQTSTIHSEYGMTELLSQAYAQQNGLFTGAATLAALVRNTSDPLDVQTTGRGALNIIDLANIHSCCFIATDDAARVHPNGQFEVLGRLDHSDTRGCSLLAV